MKINKDKLIELLVDKTNMGKTEVEEQLQQLIQRIVDAAERGKALEIKEFGLFYFDESGNLKFDPSKELSTEVNFKYAGMEPVELKPSRDSASDDAVAVPDEEEEPTPKTAQKSKPESDADVDDKGLDDIFGLDDDGDEGDEEVKTGEPDEKSVSKRPFETPADKVDRKDDPFSGLLGDASSKLSASEKGFKEESSDLNDDEVPPLPFIKDSKKEKKEPVKKAHEKAVKKETQKAPKKAVTAPAPKAKKTVKPKAPSKPSRDPVMVVISVVLVFVLITAAFFVIPGLFDEPEPVDTPVATQLPPTESDAANVLEPMEPVEESVVEEELVEEPQAVETEQARYGLIGELVDDANDGFSIVLHSFRQEDIARQKAAQFASDGYRALVSGRTVQGQTVWRVSVGQFPTIAEAVERTSDLPSPYNTDNFIQRIQTN